MKWLLPYPTLTEKLTAIPNLYHKAFLCLTYGTLGRVGEIVRSKYDSDNPAIAKRHLKVKERHLDISLITAKTRVLRIVPINREREAWLVNPILVYIEDLGEEQALFNNSTRWGEKIFEKYFGTQNIHLLRSWRASHLLKGDVTGQPVPIHVVRRMGGWTDLSILSRIYDQTMLEDYRELI